LMMAMDGRSMRPRQRNFAHLWVKKDKWRISNELFW
jgi:hypothetical protein